MRHYRAGVGGAAFATACTKPDNAHDVNLASERQGEGRTRAAHLRDLNHTIGEMKNFAELSIVYPELDLNTLEIVGFCDANFRENIGKGDD